METQSFFAKNKKMIIVGGVILFVVLWSISGYNSFVKGNVAIDGQWAQVENQYQRRFDLIPNIVNTVKGVAGQEQKVFGDIAEARTRYSGATTPEDKIKATNNLESGLGRLLVIAENYPSLQSAQAYRDLIVSLEGTENRISVERMKYNEYVKYFNGKVQVFPNSILAKIFSFSGRTYFEVPKSNQVNPTVDFSN